MLRTVGAQVHFEGVRAVDGVDFELSAGEILGLIGPNGAGKTTLVNALTGFQDPTSGQCWIGDAEVHRLAGAQAARGAGVAARSRRCACSSGLTVRENVELGAIGCGLSPRGGRQRERDELIALADFADWSEIEARSLPHGIAQRARHRCGRWPAIRASCCSTSRPRGSTQTRADELVARSRGVRDQPRCGVLRHRARHAPDHGALRPHPRARSRPDASPSGTPTEVTRRRGRPPRYLGERER